MPTGAHRDCMTFNGQMLKLLVFEEKEIGDKKQVKGPKPPAEPRI